MLISPFVDFIAFHGQENIGMVTEIISVGLGLRKMVELGSDSDQTRIRLG